MDVRGELRFPAALGCGCLVVAASTAVLVGMAGFRERLGLGGRLGLELILEAEPGASPAWSEARAEQPPHRGEERREPHHGGEEATTECVRVLQVRLRHLGIASEVDALPRGDAVRFRIRHGGGLSEPAARHALTRAGVFQIREVTGGPYRSKDEATGASEAATEDVELLETLPEGGASSWYATRRREIISTGGVKSARARDVDGGAQVIEVELDPEAGRRLGELSDRSIGRPVAIVVDGRVLSAPVVRAKLVARVEIWGQLSQAEARGMACALASGEMPLRLRIVEEGRAKP